MTENLENSAVTTGLEKVSFHSNPKERQRKECSKYHTIALISHASNAQNSPSQASAIRELPDIQAGFRKCRGTKDKIANICWIIKKAREFQKKKSIYFCFIDYTKAFVWIKRKCGKFLKRWEFLTTLPASYAG